MTVRRFSTVDSIKFKLNGPTEGEGRLEVFDGVTWGTVCDDAIRDTNGEGLCSILGYAK